MMILLIYCSRLCLSGLLLLSLMLSILLRVLPHSGQSCPHHGPLFQQALLFLTNSKLFRRRLFVAQSIPMKIVKVLSTSDMAFDDLQLNIMGGYCDDLL